MADTMEQSFFDDILETISPARLSRYQPLMSPPPPNAAIIFIPYVAIQVATAQLFPTMQLVEICLRNRIHCVMKKHYILQAGDQNKSENWFSWFPEKDRTQKSIKKAVMKAEEQITTRQIIPDDIVSRMTFGTWIALLKEIRGKYQHEKWILSDILQAICPSKDTPSIGHVVEKLYDAQEVRNRLFHHEPIWTGENISSLEQAKEKIIKTHLMLLDLLKWLAPSTYTLYTSGGMNFDSSFTKVIDSQFGACQVMNESTRKLFLSARS